MEPREGDCVKSWCFFKRGLRKHIKEVFISQISDINPTQFPVFCNIKAAIIPLT